MMSKIILHIHTYSEGVIEKDQDGSLMLVLLSGHAQTHH